MKNKVPLKNIRWHSVLESSFESEGGDEKKLVKLAGNSYRLTVTGEKGAVPLLHTIRKNIITVAGAFLLGSLIFYQSLFLAEIRVSGYRSITESQIRSVLDEAGVSEGMIKPEDYKAARSLLFSRFDRISRVTFHEKGRLLEVGISETGAVSSGKPDSSKGAVDIIAGRSGIIEKISPLEGSAKVKKGDYVNEGDVVISGKYRYQSSDYSKGDRIFTMYSHARGSVLAKVPERQIFYYEKYNRRKKLTGRKTPGMYIRAGSFSADTSSLYDGRYKASVREKKKLLDIKYPLPVSVYTYIIREAELTDEAADMRRIKRLAEARTRQHFRTKLGRDEHVDSISVEYTETQGLIKADVFAEVTEDIGVEKKIKNSKRKTGHRE